jgi:polar amino acid transport system permease protein
LTVLAAFEWSYIWDHRDELLHGLRLTLEISAIGIAGAFGIGLTLGAARAHRIPVISQLAAVYVELIRNTPILVQIFLLFFGLPELADTTGIEWMRLSQIQAAILGLGLWGSAQIAEATRGAVQSIPREQQEAAAALGFGWVGRHVNVILPQALRRLLPPLVGLVVNIIQNSTLAQILGVPELLETAERSTERLSFPTVDPTTLAVEGGDPHAIEIYGFVMIIFFVISFPLTRLAAFLERRLV